MMLLLFLSAVVNTNTELNVILNKGNESDYIPVIVHMINQADPAILESFTHHNEKIEYLQIYALNDQAELLVELQEMGNEVKDIQSFWIFNGIALKVKPSAIEYLYTRNNIAHISYDHYIMPEKTIESQRTTEWNIIRIKADSCWAAGYTGAGVIVGIIDTGADTAHVALRGKWIPGGWYDAVNGQPGPYDDHGHGTTVLGIVLGGDGMGADPNDIGVAPTAGFIVAKGFDSNGSAQLSWVHDCLQW